MTLSQLYRTRTAWFLEHVLFIGVPVTVVLVRFHERLILQYAIFGLSTLYMGAVTFALGATPRSVGLTTAHFRQALRATAAPSIGLAALILAGRRIVPGAYLDLPHTGATTLVYVGISVPIQELLFRGFCLWRCHLSFRSHTTIVLLNSLNFASVHLVFRNVWFAIGVFLINVLWAHAFLRYPNLFALALSHAVLGLSYFLAP